MKNKLKRRNFFKTVFGVGAAGFITSTGWGAEEDNSINVSESKMKEWNEWKFGLFVHFGPWSQTEIGPIFRGSKVKDPEKVQEYIDLNKKFNPVKYDPAQWAYYVKKAGMRYAVVTTKHHDGFCNFDTKLTDYKSTHPDCPYSKSAKPDIIRHYIEEFRKKGIAIGLYYSHPDQHHPEGVWWPRHLNYIKDFVTDHPKRWKSFVEFEQGQVKELLTQYGKIDIFWFDITWPKESLPHDAIPMLKMMRKLQPEMIINNRGTGDYKDFLTPEQYIPGSPPGDWWETNMTISGTSPGWSGFWYKGPECDYKSDKEIILKLADIASKGGNFLLNIGPKGDGTFNQGEIDCLLGTGKWMDVNSDAIYGTKKSPWGSPPSWGRITQKRQKVYLMVFEWPDNDKIQLSLSKDMIVKVNLLKDKSAVEYNASGDGVEIKLPLKIRKDYGPVVVVEYKGDLGVKEVWTDKDTRAPWQKVKKPKDKKPNKPDDKGVLILKPERAYISGRGLRYQPDKQNLGGWGRVEDYAYWLVEIPEKQKYKVEITMGCGKQQADQQFKVSNEHNDLMGKTINTGALQKYKSLEMGVLEIIPGRSKVEVKPVGELKSALMNFRELKLTPVK